MNAITQPDFVKYLKASSLVQLSIIEDLEQEFETLPTDAAKIDAMCGKLIRMGLVNDWHCDQLRSGKFKGFFIDKYKLLGFLQSTNSELFWDAEDVSNGSACVIAVTFKSASPTHTRHVRVVDQLDEGSRQ